MPLSMRRHNSEESFSICEMGFSEAACLHRTWEEKVCNGGRMLASLAAVEGGGGGCSEEPGGSAPPHWTAILHNTGVGGAEDQAHG